MAEYLIKSETLTAIADKERKYLGNIGKISPYRMAQYVDDVYNAGVAQGGGSSADSVPWDVITQSGARKDYTYAFAEWTSEYIRPNRKIVCDSTNVGFTFYRCKNLKKIESQYFDFSAGTNQLQCSFWGCSSLEEIEDVGLGSTTYFTSTFQNCSKLHTIAKLTVGENANYQTAFMNCNSLVNLTIDGIIGRSGLNFKWSTKLSKASIQSVILHLSKTTSGLSVTFSKTAVDLAFGDGTTIGSETAAWLGLVAEYSNWTINLL